MSSIYPAQSERDAAADCGSDPKLPPGRNLCKCSACGEPFLNVRAFEAHRYGPGDDRACMTTPHMRSVRLDRDSRGYWRLPVKEFRGVAA
jgi:hypothetical protein